MPRPSKQSHTTSSTEELVYHRWHYPSSAFQQVKFDYAAASLAAVSVLYAELGRQHISTFALNLRAVILAGIISEPYTFLLQIHKLLLELCCISSSMAIFSPVPVHAGVLFVAWSGVELSSASTSMVQVLLGWLMAMEAQQLLCMAGCWSQLPPWQSACPWLRS